jgi:hypothetical protein
MFNHLAARIVAGLALKPTDHWLCRCYCLYLKGSCHYSTLLTGLSHVQTTTLSNF